MMSLSPGEALIEAVHAVEAAAFDLRIATARAKLAAARGATLDARRRAERLGVGCGIALPDGWFCQCAGRGLDTCPCQGTLTH